MHTWPFPNIPPELFEALSPDDKRLLEALTLVYLAHVQQRPRPSPITAD
nr:hypothetical protein [uncultured Achromobacter sp.]